MPQDAQQSLKFYDHEYQKLQEEDQKLRRDDQTLRQEKVSVVHNVCADDLRVLGLGFSLRSTIFILASCRTLFIPTSIIRTHRLTKCQICAATPIKHN